MVRLSLLALMSAMCAPISAAAAEGGNLLHLAGGKDKGDRKWVRTEYLAVRAEKEAQVKIDERKSQCRVYVVRGTCIIRNEIDRSVLKLVAGTTYETTRKSDQSEDHATRPSSDLPDRCKRVRMFDTKLNTTTVFVPTKSKGRCEMISPPSLMSYSIGESAEALMPIPPDLVAHFPPSGVVADQADTIATKIDAK